MINNKSEDKDFITVHHIKSYVKSSKDRPADQKRADRVFPANYSWGTTRPLIGQAVNTIIPAILPWAAWPIRGPVVPHEKLAGNTLSALFPEIKKILRKLPEIWKDS